jgi:L-iditol 2-dehydrogenase
VLAAVLYGKEDLRLEHVAEPIADAGEVVIRVEAATTCGTDLKVWRRGGDRLWGKRLAGGRSGGGK